MLWHRLKILDPPATFIRDVQKCLNDFLWTGLHWVAADRLYPDYALGGLRLVNVSLKIQAFRVGSAVSLGTSDGPVVDTALALCHAYGATPPHPSELFTSVVAIRAPFYESVFRAWHRARPRPVVTELTREFFFALPVFDSPFIRDVTGSMISRASHGVFVAANLTRLGNFLSPDQGFQPFGALLPDSRPSRWAISATTTIAAALTRSFPGVFTARGLNPDFVFGTSPSLVFTVESVTVAGVIRVPLVGTVRSRDVYRCFLSRIYPGSTPVTVAPVDRPSSLWSAARWSPLTTRLESSVHWRGLHDALPAPNRLYHVVPAFPSPHCPFCPSLGTVRHMYYNCPFAALCLTFVLALVRELRGHTHQFLDYWHLVTGGEHRFCNFCFIVTKDVLREFYSDFASISLSGSSIDEYLRRFATRFRARVYGRYRSTRRFAELEGSLDAHRASWQIPDL